MMTQTVSGASAQTLHQLTSDAIQATPDGRLWTTSNFVATHFKKRHNNVIRDIQRLDCSPNFNLLNFEQIEYLDPRGRKMPAFRMTKDGFMFLVMGYTGPEAALIKERYIEAFNHMEAICRNGSHEGLLGVVSDLSRRLGALEAHQRVIRDELRTLPPAAGILPEITPAGNAHLLVSKIAEMSGVPKGKIWKMADREYQLRFKINLRQRARNAGYTSSFRYACDMGGADRYYSILRGIAEKYERLFGGDDEGI